MPWITDGVTQPNTSYVLAMSDVRALLIVLFRGRLLETARIKQSMVELHSLPRVLVNPGLLVKVECLGAEEKFAEVHRGH